MKNYKEITQTITNWLKEQNEKAGFDGYVIGLSGGIDSCVSAALAVKAVGKDKVHGILLPCAYTNEHSRPDDIVDAKLFAEHFGIDVITVNLKDPIIAAFDNFKSGSGKTNINPLVLANMKARMRMLTIRAYAESMHCLVLGTTNKTEDYLGYFTKGGDGGSGVDVEPIADLFKFEVYELAKFIDVPMKNITRTPSAGLLDNQTDEGEIGFTYKDIDKYLLFRECNFSNTPENWVNLSELILETYDSPQAHIKFEFDHRLVKKIESMIAGGYHKRNCPPSISL